MTLDEAIYAAFNKEDGAPLYRLGRAPSASIPRVTYAILGGTTQPILSGGAAAHRRARISLVAVAETQIEALEIIETLIGVAHGVVAQRIIKAIDVEFGPYDLPEPIEGAETMLPAAGVDLGVTYAATTGIK